jgi:pimeloyl-ACP methyl ester carboxylesterase
MTEFASSGGTLAYTEAGEGKPLLLLHGFPTSSYLWRNLAPLLAQRYWTIVPDLLGYGESAKPEDAELDIRAQARYAGELLDALGVEGELAVLGHDIGGGVAQLLALEGRASHLVLIDSISFDSWPIEGVRMIQDADDGSVDAEFAENLVTVAIELGIGKPERATPEVIAAYAAPFLRDDGPRALIRAARGIDGEGLVGTEAGLAELGERVLVLWGEDDPYQDQEWALKLSEVIPGSTVGLLPGCSHFLLEDAPETVGPLIYEWLRVRYLREPHHHAGVTTPVQVSLTRPPRPPDDAYLDE